MKKTFILLGSVAATALAVVTVVSNKSKVEAAYSPRTAIEFNNNSNQLATDMLEYRQLMLGDFSAEDYQRAMEHAKTMNQNRATFSWRDQGPDNIGGRTRAILVDKNDINHLFAGSVTGGLFESKYRGNFWTKVESFNENLAVSSICQTANGTIYVSTGHSAEGSPGFESSGSNGNGLYVSADNGASWDLVAGTSSYSYINEVVCDTINNVVWMATGSGLKKYDGSTIENVTTGPGAVNALSISKDGSVIVCAAGTSKTFVSQDGGSSFVEYSSSSNTDNPIEAGAGRIEYAISHEKVDGKYYVYASKVTTSGKLQGIWRSEDNGVNWTEIAPANDGTPGSFAPFETGGGGGQGNYDNIISVQPGNPNRIFVGGIDCYSWATTGNWTQLTQWFLSPTNPQYAHADQHEMVWDRTGRLYIGNDGGVQISDDGGQTFFPANRGYGVTQFYEIGYSAHGDVIGGAQDNGTLANYHNNSTWHEHKEVGGGDGFSADISFINRNILFGSVYYASVYRSSDRGLNTTSFNAPIPGCTPGDISGAGCGSFNTRYKLWEDPDDENSEDSIYYIPSESYNIGDEILVPSKTSGMNISYTSPINIVFDDTLYANPILTELDTLIAGQTMDTTDIVLNINSVVSYSFITGGPSLAIDDSIEYDNGTTLDTLIVKGLDYISHFYGTNPLKPGQQYNMGNDSMKLAVSWDTLHVQDRYQSWFVLGLGSGDGIWMTRNALRFSAGESGWIKVAEGTSTVTALEFSKDGNHLFIGCADGKLWRLSGFGDVYSPSMDNDTLIAWDEGHYATTLTEIESFGSPIFGIASGSDADHLVVATGSASGSIRESTNATGASPSFSPIMGSGGGALPTMPYYACVIDVNDANNIMVGGEIGTYISTNGGSSWENCSGPFGNVPVFDMGQNWRTWDEGCRRPGEIYVGTHGRGIWSTDEYLSLPEQQDNLNSVKFISNIKVYPNPVNAIGNIAFELQSNSDVTVQVFNLNGQLVNQVQENNMVAGSNVITLETAQLPKGTYIVRLTAGEKVETTKFIKH